MSLPIIAAMLSAVALWCPPSQSGWVSCRKRMLDCASPQSGELIGTIEKRLLACAKKELQ